MRVCEFLQESFLFMPQQQWGDMFDNVEYFAPRLAVLVAIFQYDGHFKRKGCPMTSFLDVLHS